jgi:hypothetical protein
MEQSILQMRMEDGRIKEDNKRRVTERSLESRNEGKNDSSAEKGTREVNTIDNKSKAADGDTITELTEEKEVKEKKNKEGKNRRTERRKK